MTQVLKMPKVLKAHSATSTVIMNHTSSSLQFPVTSYFQLVPNQKKMLKVKKMGKAQHFSMFLCLCLTELDMILRDF